jgi:Polysaccharide lyase
MNKKPTYYLTLGSIVFASLLLSHVPTHADIIFEGDYESGNFSGWTELRKCCSYSQQIVASPARAGKYAARFELRDTDYVDTGTRSEVKYISSRIGRIGGPDEWYGFSIYLPPDYEVDYYTAPTWQNELLAQWHDTPDEGEAAKSPPLGIGTTGGEWIIDTRYSSKPIQTANDGARVVHWRAPYQTGVWTDWVVHVKWSYQSDGFLEIWKDGKRIVDYRGPNTYNNQGNNYFQWGIYKWPWTNNGTTDVSKRIVYNDELRIGDSNSSYAEVAPRSSTPDTTPPSAPIIALKP